MQEIDLINSPLVRDLHRGLVEEAYYVAKKIHLNLGKKNKPFLRLLLSDKSGHLPAIYFSASKELKELTQSLAEGDIVKVSGIMEEYQSVMQMKLIKLEKADDKNWDISRFWRRTPHDRRNLYKEMKKLIEKIEHPVLQELCNLFLSDRDYMKLFLEAPASRYAHHAYIGGLLEHTLQVMRMADFFAKIYPDTDKDLMLAGAFLHDSGKVDEYEFLITIDQSVAGRLKGHTLLSYDRLKEKLTHVSLDEKLTLKLEHIILSHQGKKIWGAVEEPRFLEAYLIHAAGSTNAARFIYSHAKQEALATLSETNVSDWSRRVSYLGREIYLG